MSRINGAAARRARWAALEAVWCAASVEAGRSTLGGVAWHTLAACGARTDLPWTGEPDQVGPWDAQTMRAVCGGCPVMADCDRYVTDHDVTAGWWAGTHRDPAYVAPARPGWTPTKGSTPEARVWQGTLPLEQPA